MLVSTRGRYALRVLTDIAEHDAADSIPLKDIADRQEISEKYLEAIVRILVRDGILVGVRGKGGGYRLSRPPESISVGDVLRLTEGSLSPVSCLEEGAPACRRAQSCRTLPMWEGLTRLITDYLDGYTIADLMADESGEYNYVI